MLTVHKVGFNFIALSCNEYIKYLPKFARFSFQYCIKLYGGRNKFSSFIPMNFMSFLTRKSLNFPRIEVAFSHPNK